jgi:hypothetical protein
MSRLESNACGCKKGVRNRFRVWQGRPVGEACFPNLGGGPCRLLPSRRSSSAHRRGSTRGRPIPRQRLVSGVPSRQPTKTRAPSQERLPTPFQPARALGALGEGLRPRRNRRPKVSRRRGKLRSAGVARSETGHSAAVARSETGHSAVGGSSSVRDRPQRGRRQWLGQRPATARPATARPATARPATARASNRGRSELF